MLPRAAYTHLTRNIPLRKCKEIVKRKTIYWIDWGGVTVAAEANNLLFQWGGVTMTRCYLFPTKQKLTVILYYIIVFKVFKFWYLIKKMKWNKWEERKKKKKKKKRKKKKKKKKKTA